MRISSSSKLGDRCRASARALRSRRADQHTPRAARRRGRLMVAKGALARRANEERLTARTIGRDHVLALIT